MKIEVNIDSTSLGDSSCILKWHRRVVDGYSSKLMGDSMVYGIAVHKFIDMMYKTSGIYPKAMAAAKDLFLRLPTISNPKKPWLRDPNHLTTTCYTVWSTYVEQEASFDVLMLGEGAATEQTFSIPIYEDDYIIVRLTGTIDTLGKFKNGVFAIRDWKTTSSWDNKGYMQQYEMSRQLRIYTLACKLMAKLHPESALGKIGATKMGAFIDAIFLNAEANKTTFQRSEVHQYSDTEIDEIQMMLEDQCRKLSHAVKTGYLPKEGIVNGTCDGKYGKCMYWHVCKSNPQVGALLLGRDFIQKPFNPLAYNE